MGCPDLRVDRLGALSVTCPFQPRQPGRLPGSSPMPHQPAANMRSALLAARHGRSMRPKTGADGDVASQVRLHSAMESHQARLVLTQRSIWEDQIVLPVYDGHSVAIASALIAVVALDVFKPSCAGDNFARAFPDREFTFFP